MGLLLRRWNITKASYNYVGWSVGQLFISFNRSLSQKLTLNLACEHHRSSFHDLNMCRFAWADVLHLHLCIGCVLERIKIINEDTIGRGWSKARALWYQNIFLPSFQGWYTIRHVWHFWPADIFGTCYIIWLRVYTPCGFRCK